MEKVKWILATLGGLIATWCDKHGALIVLVAAAVVFDVLTGFLKCKVNGVKIESGKGTRGFFKKIALLVALAFGFFLDTFIPFMLSYLSIDLSVKMPFALVICFYIVVNECISICENLYECNPSTMPQWIVQFLGLAKERLEQSKSTKTESEEN